MGFRSPSCGRWDRSKRRKATCRCVFAATRRKSSSMFSRTARRFGSLRANPDRRVDRSANFRWSGDETEMLCGMCACARSPRWSMAWCSTSSVIARCRRTRRSRARERRLLRSRRRRDARGTPGTRPSDLRRYLKPLLKVRDDLVLIERHLVIRPVHHLLRGVFFDRSDRHSLGPVARIRPLYLREGLENSAIGLVRSRGASMSPISRRCWKPCLRWTRSTASERSRRWVSSGPTFHQGLGGLA